MNKIGLNLICMGIADFYFKAWCIIIIKYYYALCFSMAYNTFNEIFYYFISNVTLLRLS